MKNNYILDTNVLIQNPRAFYKFNKNDEIIIPFVVLEEIDNLKNSPEKKGESARRVNRELEKLRLLAKEQNKSLSDGIELENGSIFSIFAPDMKVILENNHIKNDNMIISVAKEITKLRPGQNTVLISKDINVRIKCDSLNINSEDYSDSELTIDDAYTGTIDEKVFVPYELIEKLHSDAVLPLEQLFIDTDKFSIFPNIYMKLSGISPSGSESGCLVKIILTEGEYYAIKVKDEKVNGISGRNSEQKYALDALMDESISMVTLSGFAGTGKTLCAIAAGLEQTNLYGKGTKPYNKIVITRPLEPFHKEIGFLPGDINEKMTPWLAPLWDNLDFLFQKSKKGASSPALIDSLIEKGIIEIRALTHIRGSSINNAFIILDEAQNLTKHELKTILTRVGMNSKIVLTGDVEQIDNPNLDRLNSGLSVVIDLFKDADITSHVTLNKGLRSELASLAIKKFG